MSDGSTTTKAFTLTLSGPAPSFLLLFFKKEEFFYAIAVKLSAAIENKTVCQ
jgi:hypothetical protein